MDPFFKGANIVWIVTILSSLIAGLNALRKYRYEKKLEQFKDTNVDLFKQEKEIVLAAISTLSVFKRDPEFKQHTTNVLLSRLYTELDYDITNAICSTLIQYSNRDELLDISSEVLNINRNFYVQTYPLEQRITDLNKNYTDLNDFSTQKNTDAVAPGKSDTIDPAKKETATENQNPAVEQSIYQIEKLMATQLLDEYSKGSLSYIPKKRYELTWHKQITADTYSRILRRAYYSKQDGSSYLWQRYFRLAKAKKEIGSHNELDMDFYQNDFNYVYMADFATSSCSIVRSAIGSAVLVDVSFNNIKQISGTTFSGTKFFKCYFQGGVIEEKSSFTYCTFQQGFFKDTIFTEADFYGSNIDSVEFKSTLPADSSGLQLKKCSFNYSYLKNCSFKNALIANTTFAACNFENAVFENITFDNTFFCGSIFKNVQFINCKGLSANHFYKYYSIDNYTKLPPDFDVNKINALSKEEVLQRIEQIELYDQSKEYLQKVIS